MHGGLNHAYNKADALNDLHTLDCTFICLTETWTAPGDAVFDLPGYVCHEVHRPQHLQSSNGPRGGIAVYLKQCVADHVKFWKSADDGTYIWLHIEPHNGCTEHIAFATCYMPPYYANKTLDTFHRLTTDMDNFASRVPAGKQPHYWVCGDTNAHTGTAPDFIRLDGHGISSDVQALDHLPADLKARANLCNRKVDARGKQQLDFCKDNELLILNGRAPGDTSGKVTFVGRGAGTLIDYHMASAWLASCTQQLEVLDMASGACRVCSDHLPVRVCFHLPSADGEPLLAAQQQPPAVTRVPDIRLDPSQTEVWQQNFAAVAERLRLQDAVTDPEAGVRAFTECVSEAAADTFQLRRRQPLKLMQRPPWFDEECRYAWREWKDAERSPVIVPYAALKLRNMYRAVRRRKQRQYMHQRMADIDKLASKDMAHLYRVFGWRRHSACPRALHSQHAHWQSKLGGCPEPRGAPELLEEDYPGGPVPSADALNAPVTTCEVCSSLQKLKGRKAAGIDGMPAELLKSGPFSMMECLASLFTAILNGKYPEQLSTGLITAVHKKGDKADLNNYRPITVIPVLAKLFASVLTRRLADWAERNNLRAPTQAGFRANRGTSDQLSVLNYIVKSCLSRGEKLYCCFVDFEKAFDTVDRDVLWAVLANIGVRGQFLKCLQSLYGVDSAAVRTAQGTSGAFRCFQGVQQGSPLSPLLFGLLLDCLHKVLKAVSGNCAPSLAAYCFTAAGSKWPMSKPVPLLLYADDLAILSTRAEGLQSMLDALQDFSKKRRLTVNLTKTEVLVFEPRCTLCRDFTYGGRVLARKDSFKYLGLWFHATQRNFGLALGSLADSARKAMHAMRRRCFQLGYVHPRRMCNLFNALVLPILSYGCEVWSWNHDASSMVTKVLEGVHLQFLRGLLGVKRTTHHLISLAEFGRYPLAVHWQKQVDKFRLRICDVTRTASDNPLFWAMFDGTPNVKNLSLPRTPAGFAALQALGRPTSAPSAERHERLFAENSDSTVATYKQMRGFTAAYRMQPYIQQIRGYRLRKSLAQIRCSSHKLRVETGRYISEARHQRTCRLCNSATATEDEQHILLQCPQLNDLRHAYSHLFQIPGQTLTDLFDDHPPMLLAKYVRAALLMHQSVLQLP